MTDGRTDGRTDGIAIAYARLAYMLSRAKSDTCGVRLEPTEPRRGHAKMCFNSMFEHTVLCLNINLFVFEHKTLCSNIELYVQTYNSLFEQTVGHVDVMDM